MIRTSCWSACLLLFASCCITNASRADDDAVEGAIGSHPNILFCIADDWGWPHASAYGAPVVQTPAFDRIAAEGVLFHHAYVSSPSCTPSRGAILTGQYHWRLEGAGNLWSVFPNQFITYPEILAAAGYVTGSSGKAWGPGRTESEGRELAGPRYESFEAFLTEWDRETPFCFWLGSSDPHRPYEWGTGAGSGMNLDAIDLPAAFPDNEVTRNDVADYLFEVQRFDALVARAIAALEEVGEFNDTIVVMTGDHGMPFPRGKGNLYDTGTRVPLAIRWPTHVPGGRESIDLVSLSDLAPTFLEVAGIEVPRTPDSPLAMTGESLLPILTSTESDQVDPARTEVLFGKERHVPCQEDPDMGGYPCRAIRTHQYLFIWNITPERWPNGTPHWENAAIRGVWLGDCDNGPTKTFMVDHQDESDELRYLYALSFAKRPEFELYDLEHDPHQLVNVAGEEEFAGIRDQLHARLLERLEETEDPRVVGGWEVFEEEPYLGSGPRHPDSERN